MENQNNDTPEDLKTPDSQFDTSKDHADVKVLPPVIVGGFLVLAIVLEFMFGADVFRWGAQLLLGLIGLSFGAGLMTWCIMRFINAGTELNPQTPTRVLVTDGPYSMSRNPIYLALVSLYLGVVIIFDIVWGLPLVIPLIYVLYKEVIAPEEAYLEREFGEDYLEYKNAVRRWL